MKDNPEVLEDNTIDVAASYDGTRHYRSFKSCHGVGIVVPIDTGEILDAEVTSKTCETCQRSPYTKDSAKCKKWQEKHISEGKCFRNFDGPSTGMETAAAKAIWSRFISKYKIQYTVLLNGRDNKTMQELNKSHVYGDKEITKLECVNHIHKRMGPGLGNLIKKCPQIKGGKGGLTSQYIVKPHTYYRKSIMDFVTQSKDAENIKSAVNKMKINIMAGLHHSIHNNDPIEQHKFWMDNSAQWCKYKKQLTSSDQSLSTQTKDNKLPASFLPYMLPL